MNSISIDIASWSQTEELLKKYPKLTTELLARYRLELNSLLDNPEVPDADFEHYISNLDNTYN